MVYRRPALLAGCLVAAHAFSPPTARTLESPRQSELNYVANEWQRTPLVGAGSLQTGHPDEDVQRQPLDYEEEVDARFHRQQRRARLRAAISRGETSGRPLFSYGTQFTLKREEFERFNHTPLPRLLANSPIPIVNFRTNSDFPGSSLPSTEWANVADHPDQFEPAEYSPCVRVTTRILVPCSDHEMVNSIGTNSQLISFEGRDHVVKTVMGALMQTPTYQGERIEKAYWLRSKLSEAIYGQIRYGTVLKRLDSPIQVLLKSSSTNDEGEWISVEYVATDEPVAVKEMSWDHIRTKGRELAEDPIKEVSAMAYLKDWLEKEQYHSSTTRSQRPHVTRRISQNQPIESGSSHIMTALDLLSDSTHLYSVMPYCREGRLLDSIESKTRFSEPEARYYMRQILQGLNCLKRAGVTHKDISPENLLVDDHQLYIIDLGMTLRIPTNKVTGERSLIHPQGVCGKWYYLSPEVCQNELPFDGPAVDLWAAAVILYIMLVGEPPWDEPNLSDENFRLMSSGNVARLLVKRGVGLSVDATDLLQRMFWADPADRLSLEQVMAHPWITHGDNLLAQNGRVTAP